MVVVAGKLPNTVLPLMRINIIKCLSHSAFENSFESLTISFLAIVNYTKLGWNQLIWILAIRFEHHRHKVTLSFCWEMFC